MFLCKLRETTTNIFCCADYYIQEGEETSTSEHVIDLEWPTPK